MQNVILYETLGGGVAVVYPTGELPVADVAKKDVPLGAPYVIADISLVPTDRTFRAAWEFDFSNPDGYGVGTPEGGAQ